MRLGMELFGREIYEKDENTQNESFENLKTCVSFASFFFIFYKTNENLTKKRLHSS